MLHYCRKLFYQNTLTHQQVVNTRCDLTHRILSGAAVVFQAAYFQVQLSHRKDAQLLHIGCSYAVRNIPAHTHTHTHFSDNYLVY